MDKKIKNTGTKYILIGIAVALVLSLVYFLYQKEKGKSVSDSNPTVQTTYEPEGDRNIFRGEEWYDLVETVEVNRENPHAAFIPYQNMEVAMENEQSVLTKDKEASSYIKSLNGDWNFHYVYTPFERDGDTWSENWDSSSWDTISVPSNVTLQRNEDGSFKYDTPIYINQVYPWVNYEPVQLSEYPVAATVVNGVYHYKRNFTVDKEWNDRQVFVNFEGVSSAFYLFINGQRVGYGEDSFTNDEFNITSYLNRNDSGGFDGVDNTIAVQVYRWSIGSYLENQDLIRLGGIFRDVDLISKDVVEIRDFFATPDLDASYKNGTINLDVTLRNLANHETSSYTVDASVYSNTDDTKIASSSISYDLDPCKESLEEIINDEGVTKSTSIAVSNPQLWFADTPNLYRLILELKDANGTVIETVCHRFGFRKIETKLIEGTTDTQMTINGLPIIIKGVNRPEYNLTDGFALTKEDIITDLNRMKENNVNSFRMSHFPNQTTTYEYADEIGLYITDEANIEAHYGAVVDTIPSNYPAWNTSVLDRTKNMVERDKNYTSIIIWSLGNESTYTWGDYTLDDLFPLDGDYCFQLSSQYIYERDPSRLRKYERDNRYTQNDRSTSIVDIASSQYFSVDQAIDFLESSSTIPYIFSEYAHSMGNALGNLKEYWDLVRSEPQLQGGYIWDFKDQAILMSTNSEIPTLSSSFDNLGDTYFSYGGDWGENTTDLDFCANGLFFADGSVSPKVIEMKKVYQDINFYDVDVNKGKISISNEYLNTDTSDLDIQWILKQDDIVLDQGSIDAVCGAHSSMEVTLPFKDYSIHENATVTLDLSVTTKSDTLYSKSGSEIAHEQFILNLPFQTSAKSKIDSLPSSFKKVDESADSISVEGEHFKIVIDYTTGQMSTYTVNGENVFKKAPYLNYYRAPINNDYSYSFIDNSASVYAESLKDTASKWTITQSEITVSKKEKVIEVFIPGFLTEAGGSINNVTYFIYTDGTVQIQNDFTPNYSIEGTIPKVGMEMRLDKQYENVTYFGKGPEENYVDRNTASFIGVYETTATNMFTSKYLRPQENGNRTDTTWLALTNDEGNGVLFTSDKMEFTALHYTYEDLMAVDHTYLLNPEEDIIVNINKVQRGLGNAVCGPQPMDQYVIQKGELISHTYQIIPITNFTQETAFSISELK